MNPKEKAIRDAASSLLDAIEEGKKAGVVVAWPANATGLASIAISETGKAAPASAEGKKK